MYFSKLLLYLKRLVHLGKYENKYLINTKPISNVFGLDRGKPIDRYYIEKYLQREKDNIKGVIMEISEDTYSRKFYNERIEKIEIFSKVPSKGVTIVGDLTDHSNLPLNKVDCFICTQTFNFIFDAKKAVEGAYSMLKNNGVLLVTLAGICQISRYDMDRWGDFWRFTDASAKKIFGDVFGEENIKVKTYGNVAVATAFLQGLAVEDLPNINVLSHVDRDYQILISVTAKKKKFK